MILQFPQKDVSPEKKARIRELWKFVQTEPAKHLCIKVKFYNPCPSWVKEGKGCLSDASKSYYRTRCRGDFANVVLHGFRNSDYEALHLKRGITSLINLRIGVDATSEKIVGLMAHEWRHYIQCKEGLLQRKYYRREPDAERYAKRIQEEWLESRKEVMVVAKSELKKQWDKSEGKLKRQCPVCKKEFSPKAWNQTLCGSEFCKQGRFLKSHLEASKKRWEKWQKEAKKKGIEFK